METIATLNKYQLRTRIPIVSANFHTCASLGCNQIRGKARGPTEQSARIIKDVRKYHGSFSFATRGYREASRNLPQCLHFIASSSFSSVQEKHIFIIISLK